MEEASPNNLEDIVHQAVCQSISLEFDDIEGREREVLELLHHYIDEHYLPRNHDGPNR